MNWASIANKQQSPEVVNTPKTTIQHEKPQTQLRQRDTRVRTNLICIDGRAKFEEWDEQFYDYCHDLWMMLGVIADDHDLILDTDEDDLFQEFRHFIYTKSSKYITPTRNEF